MSHIHKLIDFTVGAFIVYRNKVLLIHHKAIDEWLPIGGHIELCEDPDQALFREILEETGLTKKKLVVLCQKPKASDGRTRFLFSPNYVDVHRTSGVHRHIGLGYFLRSKTEKVRLSEKEHHALRWFDKSDINKAKYGIKPAIKFYCFEALKAASRRPGGL